MNHSSLNSIPYMFSVEPELRDFFEQAKISEDMCLRFTYLDAFKISAILGGGFWDTDKGQRVRLELFNGDVPSIDIIDQSPVHPKLSFKPLPSFFTGAHVECQGPGIYYYFDKQKNNISEDLHAQVITAEKVGDPINIDQSSFMEGLDVFDDTMSKNLSGDIDDIQPIHLLPNCTANIFKKPKKLIH